ncbi:MAG: hypothetical protein HZB11_02615 [Candidatus Yonathbacteria bacterium]|nr:hypothetical protein [Candidatus Yonathbacteria bacterium]
MIPFQERKKFRKIMYSKASLVTLFIVLIAAGRGAWGIHQKAVIAETERDIALRSLSDFTSRITELQASLARVKSNQGLESEIRQKYTVARPGEEVVIVVDDIAKKGKNGEAIDSKSLWQQFVSFFGL